MIIELKEKSKEELFDIADQLRYDILIKEEENKRLHSIIKEVREYIEQDIAYCKAITEPITKQQYILEILDKVD